LQLLLQVAFSMALSPSAKSVPIEPRIQFTGRRRVYRSMRNVCNCEIHPRTGEIRFTINFPLTACPFLTNVSGLRPLIIRWANTCSLKPSTAQKASLIPQNIAEESPQLPFASATSSPSSPSRTLQKPGFRSTSSAFVPWSRQHASMSILSRDNIHALQAKPLKFHSNYHQRRRMRNILSQPH